MKFSDAFSLREGGDNDNPSFHLLRSCNLLSHMPVVLDICITLLLYTSYIHVQRTPKEEYSNTLLMYTILVCLVMHVIQMIVQPVITKCRKRDVELPVLAHN